MTDRSTSDESLALVEAALNEMVDEVGNLRAAAARLAYMDPRRSHLLLEQARGVESSLLDHLASLRATGHHLL